MAHFARIQDGIVSEVIVVANAVLLDENGQEQESIGAAFCADLFGGEWVQTSYNEKFRGKFANPGFLWNGQEFQPVPPSTEEVV
jgi:hypothetical protein